MVEVGDRVLVESEKVGSAARGGAVENTRGEVGLVICGNGHNPWALALTARLERPPPPRLATGSPEPAPDEPPAGR